LVEVIGRADAYSTPLDRWRGIRRNAHPVFDADGMLGLRRASVLAAAGVWGSFDFGDTSAEPRPDLQFDSPGLIQLSLWGSLAHRTGPLVASAGIIRDWYLRPTQRAGVTEAFARARLQRGRWMSSLSIWNVIDGASGTYLEPLVSFYHFVNPFTGPAITWTTSLRAGLQLGERHPDAGAAVPGPEGTGLTHVALGTKTDWRFNLGWQAALVMTVGAELQLSRDPAARRQRDGTEGGVASLWFPIQIGVSCPLRRPE
jgi:hypothetical protein